MEKDFWDWAASAACLLAALLAGALMVLGVAALLKYLGG